MNELNFHEEVARRKLGEKPEWKACIWERMGPDAAKISGGIPRVITRGKRKGRLTWDCKKSELDVCIVTDAELTAEAQQYERTTGKCSRCQGKGQVMKRWSVTDGLETKDCEKCKGTGNADPQ